MRQNTTINFDLNLEDFSAYLSCAIKNLDLVRDALYRDIQAMEEHQTYLGTETLMACYDAMFTTVRELDRIHEEMDAAIDAAYTKEEMP